MATQLDLDEDKKIELIELEDLLTVWSDESTTKDGNKEEDILHYLL